MLATRRTPLVFAGIGLVALLVRLVLVRSGLPDLTHVDEPENLRIGVTMVAHGTALPHFYNYPSILFEVIAGVVAISGHTSTSRHFHSLVESQNLGVDQTGFVGTVLALRLVTVALSIGICLIVAVIVRRLTGSLLAATVAGLLLALSPLAVDNGVLITPDTYAGFFCALTLAAALKLAAEGSARAYVLCGIAVGLTTGAKYNGALIGLSVVAAHLLLHGRASVRRRPLLLAGATLLAAAATFLLTTPGMLLNTTQALRDIRFEAHHYATGHPGAEGHSATFYAGSLLSTETVLVVLAVIGLVAARDLRFRQPVIIALGFALPYYVFISHQEVHFSRNLMPLLPALAVLAGIGAAQVLAAVQARSAGARSVLVFATALAVAAVAVAMTLSTLHARAAAHQTAQARAWLFAHIPAGSTIYDGAYGPYIGRHYRLTGNDVDVALARPQGATALVVTELGDGRFLDEPKRYATELASYHQLISGYCPAAYFDHGPWIRILVPCRSSGR